MSDERKVRMSVELMKKWMSRDTAGYLLTWDWGEPDDEGFHSPTITSHPNDNLISIERERINKIERDLQLLMDVAYGRADVRDLPAHLREEE